MVSNARLWADAATYFGVVIAEVADVKVFAHAGALSDSWLTE